MYRSAAIGGIEQADFVNAVAGLMTQLAPQDLLTELQRIQRERGREDGGARWGPRVLDLDLLLYSDRVIDESDLKVPHPGIAERNFVLLPLAEIAPDVIVPGHGPARSIAVSRTEPRIERIG